MPLLIISEDLKCKVPLTKLVVASPPSPAASPTPDVDCVACAGRERTMVTIDTFVWKTLECFNQIAERLITV